MSKICPNCGFTESDDAKTCHICGKPLVDNNNAAQDFDYDFGANSAPQQPSDINNASVNLNQNFSQNVNVDMNGESIVPINMSDAKANKLKKNLVTIPSSIFVICIMRFVLAFMDLEDIKRMQWYIPMFEGTEFYSAFKLIIDMYYASIVILAFIVVAAIVECIFSYKVNKYVFPVKDDTVFNESKKAFYVSIVTVAVVAVYFIIEIIALINMYKMETLDSEIIFSLTDIAIPLIIDIFLVVGAVMHMASARMLSKCKRA